MESNLLVEGLLSNLKRKCKVFEVYQQKQISKRFLLYILCTIGSLIFASLLTGFLLALFNVSVWKCFLVSVCWGILCCLVMHNYRKIFLSSSSSILGSLLFFPFCLITDLLLVWICGKNFDFLPVVHSPLDGYQINSCFLTLLAHSLGFAIVFVGFGRISGKFGLKLPLTRQNSSKRQILSNLLRKILGQCKFIVSFSVLFCFILSVLENCIRIILESTLSSLFILNDNFWADWVHNFVNFRSFILLFSLTLFSSLIWEVSQFLFDLLIFTDPSHSGIVLEVFYPIGCLEISSSFLMRILSLLELRATLHHIVESKNLQVINNYSSDLYSLLKNLTHFIEHFNSHLEKFQVSLTVSSDSASAAAPLSQPSSSSQSHMTNIPHCLRIPVSVTKSGFRTPPSSPEKPLLSPLEQSLWEKFLFEQHDFIILVLQVYLVLICIFRLENAADIEHQMFLRIREILQKTCQLVEISRKFPSLGFGLSLSYDEIYDEDLLFTLRQCISTLKI